MNFVLWMETGGMLCYVHLHHPYWDGLHGTPMFPLMIVPFGFN
jgi:hypothetical protein